MKNKKHMDAEVQIRTKSVDSDKNGTVGAHEKKRARDIGDALKTVFGEKKHMEKEENNDKETSGLTPAQRKLPPKLQAAILKSKKHKKHKDADEDEDLENPEKADLNDDGELSGYEKKRGKAIERAMKDEDPMGESKKHCGMYMDKDEDEDLENPEKADLDKDGKLSSYEKKRGKAIEKATKEKKCSCGCGDKASECGCESDCSCRKPGGSCHTEGRWLGKSLPTFSEWLEWRDNQN